MLREQVAQQPPASDETPSWLRKLDRNDPKKSLPGISSGTNASNQTLLSGGWQAREAETISAHGLEEEPLPLVEPQPDEITDPAPTPLEKAALAQQPTVSEGPMAVIAAEPENFTAETDEQAKNVPETAQSSPSLEERPQEDISPPSPQFAGRELRVKVWEPEEDASETSSDDVEDLPTQIITTSSVIPDLLNAASQPVPMPGKLAREQVEQLDTVQMPSEPVREQIEEVDTVQVTAYPKPGPATANPPSLTGQTQNNVAQPANQQASMPGITARPAQRPPSLPGITPLPSVQRPLSQPGITPLPAHQQISMPGITPLPAQHDISSPGLSPQEPRPNVQQNVSAAPLPGRQQAVPMALSRRSRPRLPIIAAIILIPIVLLGGLAFGIVQTQRMNDLAVTQPWQQLHDEKLGIAFAYPSGWQTQADYAKSTLHVHDSSNTAQVNIIVAKAPGGDVAQYLSQQAKQMQIADAKSGTPVSFAHASWTQIQGSTLQGGANYTTTLLATVHNSRLFTIGFLAPTSNYADQEKVNFSHLRASWSFL
ncbi:hypothetical protein KSF_012160 [Reticulibacter mediterranei]|uniref:Uncharacterized protein n=1 Tax=Reticulibacter mediterranei TaxID=2778369 RepID=A0A8J3IER3_9CHLR|nr:hypothetical protein [Reticulibacter mediterranei]GHO91168.1 hypothetical protein KSF_012160 [Reticulibacter mediterranei]